MTFLLYLELVMGVALAGVWILATRPSARRRARTGVAASGAPRRRDDLAPRVVPPTF